MTTDNPFGSDQPVEYVPPSAEAVPQMVDSIATMVSAHGILLYRIYDMLSVIANAVDVAGTKAIMARHEQGEIISPPAWFNETQNDVT